MKKYILAGLIILVAVCLTGCSLSLPTGKAALPSKFKTGDTIVIANDYEIRMKSMEFSPKIIPADPGTFYSTFEVDSPDKTYFHAVFEITNLRNAKETADKIMTVSLLYDNKTAYLCSSAVERDGDFSLSNDAEIVPLSTETVHYIAEVPKELTNGNKSTDTQITVNDHVMTCAGDGTVGNSIISLDLGNQLDEYTEWQAYEEFTAEQSIENEGFGKLTLEKTSFTNSVEPANKGSLYAVNGTKEQDRVYLDAVFTFENTAADSVEAGQVLQATVIYDNKYVYDSFVLIEQGKNADLFDTSMIQIKPRATGKLHYAFELPQKLEKSSKPLVLIISFNSKDYYCQIR